MITSRKSIQALLKFVHEYSIAPCNRIRNPESTQYFLVWNPESRKIKLLKSGVQEDKGVEIWNPEDWNPESKTSVDSVPLSDFEQKGQCLRALGQLRATIF